MELKKEIDYWQQRISEFCCECSVDNLTWSRWLRRMTHLVNISVGSTSNPLNELVVILRISSADVSRHNCSSRWSRHVMPSHHAYVHLPSPYACGLYNVSLCLGVSTAIISLPHHCHYNHWYSLHLHLEVNLLTVKSTFVFLIYLQNEQENLVLNSTQKQSHYEQTSPKSLSPIK